MGRLSKREKKARLKGTVLDYARRGVSIKEISERCFLHRNTVAKWIKEGEVKPVKVKAPSTVAEKPLSEYELLREIEKRLPSEVKAREKEYQTAMEALKRLRRRKFPEVGYGLTTEPDF